MPGCGGAGSSLGRFGSPCCLLIQWSGTTPKEPGATVEHVLSWHAASSSLTDCSQRHSGIPCRYCAVNGGIHLNLRPTFGFREKPLPCPAAKKNPTVRRSQSGIPRKTPGCGPTIRSPIATRLVPSHWISVYPALEEEFGFPPIQPVEFVRFTACFRKWETGYGEHSDCPKVKSQTLHGTAIDADQLGWFWGSM